MINNVLKPLAVALLLGMALLSVSTVQAAPVPKTIGEAYEGGIVFYVDLDGMHGLIAARANQSASVAWSNVNGTNLDYRVTGATRDGLYAGAMNTAMIIATQMGDNQAGNFAAKVAASYKVQDNGVTACTALNPPATETCYGDWYLPSKDELNLMYNNIGPGAAMPFKNLGGFANNYYWSSTELDSVYAWIRIFGSGYQSYGSLKNLTFAVRAVRAF